MANRTTQPPPLTNIDTTSVGNGVSMKREREEWDNEGGQLRPNPELNEPLTAPELVDHWMVKALPFGLTAATVGIALAVAFN